MHAGFKKEQLRAQIDNYGRLRISGERPLEGSQWSRFRTDFHVPEGYNASGIRARFEKDGFLHIIMPRLSPAGEPKVAEAKTGDDAGQDQKAAGHGTAQQTAAAEAEQEKKRQEDDASKRPGQQEEHTTEGDGGRGEAVAAPTTRPAYGVVRDRRKMVWTLLLAVVLALVGAGLYAKYRLMDPSAEPAPADDHIVGLSDY